MSLHRTCCCGQTNQCVCTGCRDDFASSYYLTGPAVTLNWEIRRPFKALLCPSTPPCYGIVGVEEWLEHEVTATVSVSGTNGTVTQYTDGQGCCYRRTGNIGIAFSFDIISYFANYLIPGTLCCDKTTTITGTEVVPYCYTVTPCCINDVCHWSHTLALCGFVAGEYEWVPNVTTTNPPWADCADMHDRSCFYVSGAVMQWRTPYKPLDQLLPQDFTFLGFCPQCSSNCLDGGDGTVCDGFESAALQQQNDGPWSLWLTNNCAAAPCSTPSASDARFPSANFCRKLNLLPQDQWLSFCSGDIDDRLFAPCCENSMEITGYSPPDYA